MAVVAIEAFARRKPHEAQAVLHDGEDAVLRQPIVRGEMREFQVPDRRHAALCELNGALGIGCSALCEHPVFPACGNERDDCEQERKALQTTSRPDSCGTHRAIFPSSLRTALAWRSATPTHRRTRTSRPESDSPEVPDQSWRCWAQPFSTQAHCHYIALVSIHGGRRRQRRLRLAHRLR